MHSCYLCGNPATKPLLLKSSFTAHSSARCTSSNLMCDRCDSLINGELQQCWYFNPNKQVWSVAWSRNFSWLESAKEFYPKIGDFQDRGGKSFRTASELPTRIQLREWLLNPPVPPFTISIAESGQKHTRIWALEAIDRDFFPVQFELDTLHINRAEFTQLIECYEKLMFLDFSKTEINSGDYHSDRLMKCLTEWDKLELQIVSHRGTRLFQLISHVAQKPDAIQPKIVISQPETISIDTNGQMCLF